MLGLGLATPEHFRFFGCQVNIYKTIACLDFHGKPWFLHFEPCIELMQAFPVLNAVSPFNVENPYYFLKLK
jgi:hypothetical protein